MHWRNILERAGWTFVQSAISTYLGIEIALDVESQLAAIVAAAVAGAAAVLSMLKTIAQEQLGKVEETLAEEV